MPLHKKGDKDDINNFRPISILPVFSKIFEKVVLKRLVSYLETAEILCEQQHGYRKGHSTVKAIVTFMEEVFAGMDRSAKSSAIFLDLSKAFDCVNHDILINKLHYYGIRGNALDLFRAYLTNRQHIIEINGKMSSSKEIKLGIPQGSLMSGILFLVYINDLSCCAPDCKMTIFADDTTLYNEATTETGLDQLEQKSLHEVTDWFNSNKLKLNSEKTQKLTFNLRTSNHQEAVKVLGVYLHDGLNWQEHIDDLCKKLSIATYQIRKVVEMTDASTGKLLYYSNFHSRINYSIILWGSTPFLQRVFVAQKKVLRTIARLGPSEHCRPIFIEMKILTAPSLYIYNCVMYIKENLSKFDRQLDIHCYQTRKDILRIPLHRLTTTQRSVVYQGIKFYNAIGNKIKEQTSRQFGINLKAFLVNKAFYSVQEFVNDPDLTIM